MSVSHARANVSSQDRRRGSLAAVVLTLAALTPAAGARPARPFPLAAPSGRAYAGSSAPPQQEPSELDKLLLKRRRPKTEPSKPTPKPDDTPAAGGRGSTRGRGTKAENAAPGGRAAVGLSVTFVANEPEVEITVLGSRGKVLLRGRTGADHKFTTKISPGAYTISLTRAGRLPRFQQQISVLRDNTTLTLNFPFRPKESEEERAAAEAKAAPTPAPAPAPPPVSPEVVIKNFLDPKETEAVTVEDWQQVLTQTRASLQQEPNNRQLKGRELLASGQIDYLRGSYDDALSSFKQAAPLSTAAPDLWLVALGLGNAHLAKGQAAEAADAYTSAIQMWPDFALAYKGLGDARSKMRNASGADAAYARAKSLGYVPAELFFNKKYQEARASMKKDCAPALKLFLDLKDMLDVIGVSKVRGTFQADMFADMGYCYAELKQTDNAHDSYRRAITLDPDNAWPHYRYGETLFNERAYADASKELDRALRLFELRNQPGDRDDYKRALDLKEKADKKLSKTK